MTKKILFFILASISLICQETMYSQTITVKDTVMLTYPFGDPDEVPETNELYPYWKFRSFTKKAVEQSWKMVVLENQYLRVKIFPEIGGKIWSVFDKISGNEMFYDNDVVKFREIALRGPWTSGGIEFNYGIIGHAPSCSTPVDWYADKKRDGSVSCYIGVTELLSRSRWTLEINLPEDAVWMRTTSTWHNGSGEYQPYYSWANSGVQTSDDMILIYPSDNAIGHGGENIVYPVDERGRDLSKYANQTFGADKSFHMVGSHKSFFGAYYPGNDHGVMHWSLRDEKLGRKYFAWAQSRQGGIWIDLLTDTRPQYIEMQSGRLYNQNAVSCSESSPYRQILFSPFATDVWSDFWIPFSGIGPADNVTRDAVSSVNSDGKKCSVGIFPLKKNEGVLSVLDSTGKSLYKARVSLAPGVVKKYEIKGNAARITLGERTLWRKGNENVDRPQKRNPQFDASSVEARLLLARDLYGMRNFRRAETIIDDILAENPAYAAALDLKAYLLLRKGLYADAYAFSDKALAVDQYDPDAGYAGGLAAEALGKTEDAMDRLETAAISNSAIRTAALTALARIAFKNSDKELTAEYARKALACNAWNITALCILCKSGYDDTDTVSGIDPLNHFPAAEKLLGKKFSKETFAEEFRSEIPWEDCLDLALFYHGLGLNESASAILEASPEKNALTELWKAYLNGSKKDIAKAEQCSVVRVFPFRRESLEPLRWAVGNGGGWRSRYLLAMLEDFLGNGGRAAELMKDDDSDYAPYYAYRYSLSGNVADLEKARVTDPEEWRYTKMIFADMAAKGKAGDAVPMMEEAYGEHPGNVQIGDALVDAYMAAGLYGKADGVMEVLEYLPFEGMRDSHDKYRHIKLHLAAEALERGDRAAAHALLAQARLWPERLGAGKPYDELLDTSVEDWLESRIDSGETDHTIDELENKLKKRR